MREKFEKLFQKNTGIFFDERKQRYRSNYSDDREMKRIAKKYSFGYDCFKAALQHTNPVAEIIYRGYEPDYLINWLNDWNPARLGNGAMLYASSKLNIPDGWQIVPIECSDEMIDAACDASNLYRVDFMRSWNAALSVSPPTEKE